MHVLTQPVEQTGELARGELVVEFRSIGPQALVQLSRDYGADRV